MGLWADGLMGGARGPWQIIKDWNPCEGILVARVGVTRASEGGQGGAGYFNFGKLFRIFRDESGSR
jgi:hypothetical protein